MIEMSTIRLLQLVSPTLPTGAFSYSQGLECAVETGWVCDGESLGSWLRDVISNSITYVDIPLLKRMYRACTTNDHYELKSLCDTLLACRESHEMQQEEISRGRAMATLLEGLGLIHDSPWKMVLSRSQLAGYCMAASRWDIPTRQAAIGYLWSWLENQVQAGIKIVPLGQTVGQQLLVQLIDTIPSALDAGLNLSDQEIGASSPALAIASSLHETQYTRIYRS